MPAGVAALVDVAERDRGRSIFVWNSLRASADNPTGGGVADLPLGIAPETALALGAEPLAGGLDISLTSPSTP